MPDTPYRICGYSEKGPCHHPNHGSGVDPRQGVDMHSPKARNLHVGGQDVGFCAWRYGDKKLKRLPCSKKASTCKKCFTHGGKPSEYEPVKKKKVKKCKSGKSA